MFASRGSYQHVPHRTLSVALICAVLQHNTSLRTCHVAVNDCTVGCTGTARTKFRANR